jgi:hypothetical protein
VSELSARAAYISRYVAATSSTSTLDEVAIRVPSRCCNLRVWNKQARMIHAFGVALVHNVGCPCEPLS